MKKSLLLIPSLLSLSTMTIPMVSCSCHKDSEQIRINQGTSLNLYVGYDTQLLYTIKNPKFEHNVVWSSSNEDAATVNDSGLVVPIAPGKTTITVKTADNSNLSASCEMTVYLKETPLCFEKDQSSETDPTIGYTVKGTLDIDIECTTTPEDSDSWVDWDGTSKTLSDGNKLYVRNTTNKLSIDYQKDFRFIMSNGAIKASGNVDSMMNYSPLYDYCYRNMFTDCACLITAPDLPAVELGTNCYIYMFNGCSKLTTAPDLSAISLAESCYYGMFKNCTSLKQIPELPAISLTFGCYSCMFEGCESLTVVPELPATTLDKECYFSMFESCKALTVAPQLPATSLADSCYEQMFQYCYSLTAAPELPATSLAESCYEHMFDGCDALISPPELPAKQLAKTCYECMFQDCISLTSVPKLLADTLVDYCYCYMFGGCISLIVNKANGDSNKMIFTCPTTPGLEWSVDDMFFDTKGTRDETPIPGVTYYWA